MNRALLAALADMRVPWGDLTSLDDAQLWERVQSVISTLDAHLPNGGDEYEAQRYLTDLLIECSTRLKEL